MQLPKSWNKVDTKIATDFTDEKVSAVRKTGKKTAESLVMTDRMGRAGGVTTGTLLCKAETELADMDVIPTFDVPGLGKRRLTTIMSWPGTLYLALAPEPGALGQAFGLASFALTVRGDLGVDDAA